MMTRVLIAVALTAAIIVHSLVFACTSTLDCKHPTASERKAERPRDNLREIGTMSARELKEERNRGSTIPENDKFHSEGDDRNREGWTMKRENKWHLRQDGYRFGGESYNNQSTDANHGPQITRQCRFNHETDKWDRDCD